MSSKTQEFSEKDGRGRVPLFAWLSGPGLGPQSQRERYRKARCRRAHGPGRTPPTRPWRIRPGLKFKPDLAHDNEPLHRLLYGGRMMEFYERFLGGPVRHYDFTWMRAVAPGYGTHPRRHRLHGAWYPRPVHRLDPTGRHRLPARRPDDPGGIAPPPAPARRYLARDVDTYCENVQGEEER